MTPSNQTEWYSIIPGRANECKHIIDSQKNSHDMESDEQMVLIPDPRISTFFIEYLSENKVN